MVFPDVPLLENTDRAITCQKQMRSIAESPSKIDSPCWRVTEIPPLYETSSSRGESILEAIGGPCPMLSLNAMRVSEFRKICGSGHTAGPSGNQPCRVRQDTKIEITFTQPTNKTLEDAQDNPPPPNLYAAPIGCISSVELATILSLKQTDWTSYCLLPLPSPLSPLP